MTKIAVPRCTTTTSDGRRAVLMDGEDRPRWDGGAELTDDEMINFGFRDHPALTAYVEAVKGLQALWDAIPDGHSAKHYAEYRTARIPIPHIEFAKDNWVFT